MKVLNLSRRGIILKILIGIFVVSACLSCSKTESAGGQRSNSNANPGGENAAVTITVDKSVGREIPSFIQATGSLVADETSDIATKVAGKVTNIYVNVGQFVSQGSVIAKLDENEARLQLAQAQANVTQLQAGVRQAEARLGLAPNGTFTATTIPEVRAANANYEQALAELRQAEANEKRYRELVETGDVSLINYETFRTTRDTARARVNAAKQSLEAAANAARQNNEAIKAAQAAVEASRTQVDLAQQAVADTTIRAVANIPERKALSPFSIAASTIAEREVGSIAGLTAVTVPPNFLSLYASTSMETPRPMVIKGTLASVTCI